ncbi:hypothetical protein [Paenibacillus glacialis]|uniref:Uncharacterized protein n=1 Tax=Paenibacillus glacialis TaxID=494026 RepID=A0A168MLG1_9BACL|nr:hypothetical protein [Paenibacillus glacialis]OAB44812.1 hypothetical protein PGLA_05215 [Paenibacillus glacialis]
MKNFLLRSIMIVIFVSLIGCQQNTTQTENLNTKAEAKVETKADMVGFVEPEPSDWVKYTKSVREYMYYRTKAVVNKDINILWEHYPELKDNTDRKQGVNIEKDEVESLNQDFDLLDANYNIESYEPMKVKTINDNEVVVLIHGSIIYLRNDFDESGGEYLMKVFLELKNNHWTVVRTDEYTLPEYKEWLKEKE